MVVVSGTWSKKVFTYPAITMDSVVAEPTLVAKAVLIARPNSHPFEERTLALELPVKVGRAVARARAAPNNAIFDCKVLSRHHALLWYKNGQFFLQDTKSSNGTFVNNNRLAADPEGHEVSSGDIVQFGVDVLENNRKVTHGCIIATLKLYLPDGKEAKASPSILENNTHVVPLDELYKLHEVIQEATQREQCLEAKLSALQCVVDEARKSAEESWQAYVGEERLLSRVSALETQLQQATKGWGEDKFREEMARLRDDNGAYQVAAKAALEKLHAERLEALQRATEQERCRISAGQEVLLVREQLGQLQRELEEVCVKLTDEQQKAKDAQAHAEQQLWDVQMRLVSEVEQNARLRFKLRGTIDGPEEESEKGVTQDEEFPEEKGEDFKSIKGLLGDLIFNDDLKSKEDRLAENEIIESEMNKANGVDSGTESDHINLTVAPVSEETVVSEPTRGERHVSFSQSVEIANSPDENEKDDLDSDSEVDSKTLKYKYQSAQNALKRKMESLLESNRVQIDELERNLDEERKTVSVRVVENHALKEQLAELEQKWKASCNESQQLKDRVVALVDQSTDQSSVNQSTISVSYEQLVSVEEELVVLKERYATTNDEKIKLQQDLKGVKAQYDKLCNSSYDRMYFYVVPLILIILYLVISAMIS